MRFFVFFIGLALAGAARAEPCVATAEPGTKCRLSLARLRPSQGAVGMWEVKRIMRDLRRMQENPEELKAYLKKKRIEVVIGPGGEFHVIDGHHHATAIHRLGLGPAYVEIVDNLSDLTENEFWKKMEKRHWLRLTGKNGAAITVKQLPRTLRGLKDDPYRSLAGIMGRVKGYKSSSLPFVEFQWADYLRDKIPPSIVKRSWDAAVKRAIELGFKGAAEDLPGYTELGKRKRRKKFEECWESFHALKR